MRFKDYEDYKNQRDALLKEAEDFLNAGKTEEYQSKADEVRELDAAFDTWKEHLKHLLQIQLIELIWEERSRTMNWNIENSSWHIC